MCILKIPYGRLKIDKWSLVKAMAILRKRAKQKYYYLVKVGSVKVKMRLRKKEIKTWEPVLHLFFSFKTITFVSHIFKFELNSEEVNVF